MTQLFQLVSSGRKFVLLSTLGDPPRLIAKLILYISYVCFGQGAQINYYRMKNVLLLDICHILAAAVTGLLSLAVCTS